MFTRKVAQKKSCIPSVRILVDAERPTHKFAVRLLIVCISTRSEPFLSPSSSLSSCFLTGAPFLEFSMDDGSDYRIIDEGLF